MIPDPKNPTPTAESVVLEILSTKPRLTVKDIYEYFNRKYGQKMTLQAFYNLIRRMIDQRVLVKENHLVSVDASWIHLILQFGQTLKKTYLDTTTASTNVLLKEGEIKSFDFDRVIDMDNFWNNALFIVAHYYEQHDHPDKNVFGYNHHSWFQLVRTNQEQSLARTYEQLGSKYFIISGSKSFLDTLTKSLIDADQFYYTQTDPQGMFKPNYYATIVGDFIFEASIPKYIAELLEQVYNRTNNISEFNANDILSLITMPGKTTLTISRSKKRAGALRKEMYRLFERTTK